jgi:hypothetical protein
MTLRNVLLINAISSGITGILLAVMPTFFAKLFNVNQTAPFVEVGIFLIVFSLFVLWTSFKNPIPKTWTKLIIGMDVTWVVASILAVPLLFSSISVIGSVIILAVAGWVGTMAYLQRKTLQRV